MNARKIFAGMALLALGVPGATLSAQARFAILDSTVRFANYVTVEECVALADRLNRQYGIRDDSSRYNKERDADPLFQANPRITIDWTRKCMAKFQADTAPIDSSGRNVQSTLTMRNWELGYLLAADVSSARTIMDRQLSVLNDAVLLRAIDDRRSAYRGSGSVDVEWDDFLDSVKLARTRHWPRSPDLYVEAVEVFGGRMQRAWSRRRIAEAQSKARDLLDYIANFKLTDEEHNRLANGRRMRVVDYVHMANRILAWTQIQDSVRLSGPEAYVRLRHSMWNDALKHLRNEVPLAGVGIPAKPVRVSFVFPRDSGGMRPPLTGINADSSIPSREKVTLLVFERNACRLDGLMTPEKQTRRLGADPCYNTMGVIRRLAQRFPSLDITIVTQTEGAVGPKVTADSLEEAQLLRALWQDHHRLPVNIAVAYTPFFRLPAPDSRRVNEPIGHIQFYSNPDFFAGAPSTLNHYGFIIVPGMKVLDRWPVVQTFEHEYVAVLTPLMEWYDRTRGSKK